MGFIVQGAPEASTGRLLLRPLFFFFFFFIFFFFLGETSSIGGCFFCGFVVPGAPEGSTGRRF